MIVVAWCGFLLAPGAALAGTLDQQQATDTSTAKTVSIAQGVAQTFTAGVTGNLDQVDLKLSRNGTPTVDLGVEIRDVSGGQPGNRILAGTLVPPASVPATAQFVPVTMDPQAPVVTGGQYAIVLYSFAGSAVNDYAWFFARLPAGDPYQGGGLFSTASPPSGPWFDEQADAAFKTYVVPSTPPATGQPAAPLKKCKRKHGAKRKHCRKRAKRLPV